MKLRKNFKGFTLVEVMVAVSILALVLAAVVVLETQNLQLSGYNTHRLQAENLAQSALNLTGTIRDNNVFKTPTTPFAGMVVDTGYCLTQIGGAGTAWSLTKSNCITNTNANVSLNNIVYTITITIE